VSAGDRVDEPDWRGGDPAAPVPHPEVRDYLARVKARRRAPRFTVEHRPGKPVRLDQTQVHPGVAAVRMMNAMGTTSVDLADRLVGHLPRS